MQDQELVEQLDTSTWDELISIRTNGSGWIAAVDANGRTLAVRDVSDIDDESAHDCAVMDLLGDALDVVSAQ